LFDGNYNFHVLAGDITLRVQALSLRIS
ncbi:MAG: hypothetical protein QOF93_1204, partial [Verrucomicrobiota bacterium]